MPQPKPVKMYDEIDLWEFLLSLWRGKYIILSMSVLAIVVASFHLHRSARKYSVEVIFKPVLEASSSPDLSRFSGLASLAGVALPTSNSSDFTTYQRLIFSEEVAERVFVNTDLMRSLFKGEWNSETESFESQPDGRVSKLKQFIKSSLTGFEKVKYTPPNPKRLSMLVSSTFKLSVDRDGFLSVTTETTAPDLMIKLISDTSQETDRLLKERFFVTAEETLEFYYQKLLISRSPEHREALAKLISAEDQKLMLASKNTNFVAELLTTPSVSAYPTSPNSSLVLLVGLVSGIFLGAAIVLIRQAIKTLGLN